MKLYVDTSAFVKLVVGEDGSAKMEALWSAPACVTSCLTYAEARAALAAAERRGRISGREARRAGGRLESLWDEVVAVSVDAPLSSSAGDLAATHGLSGADAVHLATALAVAGDDLAFATWDERLGRAAAAVGFTLVPG